MGRTLETFKPLKDNLVKIYHCGPTVYWTQHIGNMRGMTVGDLIRRSVIYLGYQVKYVRNYTDFGHLTSDADTGEDKIEKAAHKEKTTPKQIADKYIQQFEDDTAQLNILEPNVKTRATDYLEEMIVMVKALLDKGFAYSTPAAIYFDISKFPKYTELSGQDLSENITGAGTGNIQDKNKKKPADFALWFFRSGPHKNALQYWPSPFFSSEVEKGYGFPGWHIECSAMISKVLGKTIDMHIGGVEHIPIHHTNEIAQSESTNGVKFVNYWLHNEHLVVNNEKMSKSAGTGLVLADITTKGFQPMDLRYFFLQAHYRGKQNFNWESLAAAKSSLKRLVNFAKTWNQEKKEQKGKVIKDLQAEFQKKLEDDFNIPQALALVWELTKYQADPADKLVTLLDFDRVLGLKIGEQMQRKAQIPAGAQKLLTERESARKSRDFARADAIRKELERKYQIKLSDKAL